MDFKDPIARYSQSGVYHCAGLCSRTEQGWGQENSLRRNPGKFGGVMWDQSLRLKINSASKTRWALADAPFSHSPAGSAVIQAQQGQG